MVSASASTPVDQWAPSASSLSAFLAQAPGEGPFLVELDRSADRRREFSRAQWQQRMEQVSTALQQAGATVGDHVAMVAGNDADALVVAFACWRAGLVYVPLSLQESDERLHFIVSDAQARLIICVEATAERARTIGIATDTPVHAFDELHGSTSGDAPDLPADGMTLPLDHPALRIYTSGTTGNPKGVQLSGGNLLTDGDALAQVTGWDRHTGVLVVLPIHHVNGLIVSCLLSWLTGARVVLCDRFRSDTFWADVAQERITTSSLVPTLLEFLLEQGQQPAPEHFTEVFCGAGPLSKGTAARFEDTFGVAVRQLYGLSETTAVATTMPRLAAEQRRQWYQDHDFPSIGPAVPHVQVAVHGPDDQPLGPGERGELVIRGATVMSGYAGLPEETAQTLRGGWFHSGDEGFWMPAADGTPFFFISGRIKELFIRGGVNLSPLPIDEVLLTHPAVRHGLAVPFENKFYGEEIGAYVVASSSVSEQEILDHCAATLDFASRPKVVIFGDEVPFTSTGKARRIELKRRLAPLFEPYRDVQFRRPSS